MNVEDVFGFNLTPKQEFGEEPKSAPKEDGEWVGSQDEENFSMSDRYATREEAIKFYPEDAGLEPGDRYFIGKAISWKPMVNGDSIIERMSEEAYDDVGEFSERWLRNVGQGQIDELSDMMTATFERWMSQHGQTPTFFRIEKVDSFTVPGEVDDGDGERDPLQTLRERIMQLRRDDAGAEG